MKKILSGFLALVFLIGLSEAVGADPYHKKHPGNKYKDCEFDDRFHEQYRHYDKKKFKNAKKYSKHHNRCYYNGRIIERHYDADNRLIFVKYFDDQDILIGIDLRI